jgi:hypothetical protein
MGAALLCAATPALADDAGGGATPPAGGGGGGAAGGGGADAGAGKKMTVGADLVGVLPLGDYSDGASFAVGPMGRFEFAVNDKLHVTARVGYLYHLGTPTGVSLYIIPIHGGVTYTLMPKLFGWAEVGLSHIATSFDAGGVSGSNSDDKLALAVGAGYEVMPKVKARAGFYMPGSQDASNGMGGTTTKTLFGIMFSAGYDFVSF